MCKGLNHTINNFNIIGREDQGRGRTIRGSHLHNGEQFNIRIGICQVQPQSYMRQIFFSTPGLKLDSSQNQLHLNNNGQTQINITNNQPQLGIGHSGHALNSEHVFRET